jgi:glycosyltransferase involved in cell wall biosynthesis
MKKILYTIPNFDTAGSGKALLKIAERLDKARFEPHICCMHDRGAFFEVVKKSGIPVHLFPYTADMSNRFAGIGHVWRTARFFKSIRPDLIHSFHYAADYSEPLAARIARIKWVYTKKNMNWGGSSKNGWRLRSCLANGIIAQNTDMMHVFFKNWRKMKLISRGVDVDEFCPQVASQEVRDKLRLSQKERFILCVANLVPVKGIEVLIEAFAKSAPVFPDVELAIVGDDRSEYAEGLKKKSIELNLSDRIYFTGKVLNVSDYLSAASIFVLPTLDQGRREGSPVSLLEAMASGALVLASSVAGIRDQLSNFPDLQFEPGNANELAQKLKMLLGKPPDDLRRLGAELRQEVLKRFTIEREVREHTAFYDHLLR